MRWRSEEWSNWPRIIVQASKETRDAPKTGPGAARAAAVTWSRDELPPRIAEILDADPAVTIEQVTHALDIAYTTAKRNLAQLRGKRIADRPQTEPELTPHQSVSRAVLWRGLGVRLDDVVESADELRTAQVRAVAVRRDNQQPVGRG
ncbi:hypothetical protein [Streptomyces sp. NPDC059928]|uniref:hypothetical protein n=1 Tax=unclassified Streptomyces TaxID=2593676 RepID=UPI0036580D5C